MRRCTGKNRFLILISHLGNIFQMGNLMYLKEEFMYMDLTIVFAGPAYCVNDYVCWSAPVDDLGNWQYEGVIYKKTQDPLNTDGHMCLYAPDVTVGVDGKYYLYYVLDKVPVVSVAVCDTPAGSYEFYGYVHYQDGTLLGKRRRR